MSRVLVLGWGNTLRGDDAAGWLAAEALRKTPLRGVEVRALHQLSLELATGVADARAVVFLDATVAGSPGLLAVREVGPPPPDAGFTHRLTPAALMEIAGELYGRRPRAWEVTIAGASFGLGEGLSTPVAARLPALTALVARLARSLGDADREEDAAPVRAYRR